MKVIYINVATINNFNEVLNTLLDKINTSGLYDECLKIIIVVNGDISLLNVEKKEKYDICCAKTTTNFAEFPTLNLLWYNSVENSNIDYDILYLHTKGVTKPDDENIKDWVNYLSYFNITKWQDRINELKTNDATGVNLSGSREDYNYHPSTWGYSKAPIHYSGNFWWSKASYIRNLIDPYKFALDDDYLKWRVMCEMWLCHNYGNFHNAYSSNVNHYTTTYKESKYI